MNAFISYFLDFFTQINDAISNYFNNSDFSSFLGKQLLNGSMVSTPLTFNELFRFVIPIALLALFFVLIFKFFKQLLGIFIK